MILTRHMHFGTRRLSTESLCKKFQNMCLNTDKTILCLLQIRLFQTSAYEFEENLEIKSQFDDLPMITEEEMYQKSLEVCDSSAWSCISILFRKFFLQWTRILLLLILMRILENSLSPEESSCILQKNPEALESGDKP